MNVVRYILTPQLVGAQRLIHRDKHLTLVIGPPVNTCATSKVATQTHLTKAEAKYVFDAVEDLDPELNRALQANDFSHTSCPCTVPQELKFARTGIVEELPCPIHDRDEYAAVVGSWKH